MAIDVPIVAARPQAAVFTAVPEVSSFDERWAAWQAKGVAHDQAFRRKMAVVGPILVAVAALVIYALVGR